LFVILESNFVMRNNLKIKYVKFNYYSNFSQKIHFTKFLIEKIIQQYHYQVTSLIY